MKKGVLILGLAALLLSGRDVLPYPRELEQTFLVRVLGVDWTADGVALTAAGEEKGKLLAADGSTAAESHRALKRAGEEYVALTHVTQILVGEGGELRAVLEGALKGKEVGQTATVWLCAQGSARALMEATGGGALRLTSIELNAAEAEARTVVDALAELEERGEVTLPALAVQGETMEFVGMKKWKEGKG